MKNVEINDTDHIVDDATYKMMELLAKEYPELKKTLAEREETLAGFKVNFELIVDCVLKMTDLFGLNDPQTGMIRESILNNTESPMRAIVKQLTSLMTEVSLAQMSKEREAKLKDRFAFFGYLPYVSEFYMYQKQIKVEIPAQLLINIPDNVKKALTDGK